jgi:F-type H+-transporting ATPase subunit b
VEKAHAAIAAADAKTQEYEARLRAARAEIFHAREQRLQQWNTEREKALASARLAAHERIALARKTLEADAEGARKQIETSVDQLASEILQAILPARAEELR